MVSRRDVLASAAATLVAGAQVPPMPDVVLVLADQPALVGAIEFTRAWAACPEPKAARASLLSGCFPHAIKPDSPSLEAELKAAGMGLVVSTQIVTPRPGDIVVVTSANPGPVRLSLRHPRLVSKPGEDDFLLSHVDVMPTLLGLSGLPIPAAVQGRDHSALLLEGRGARPESIYAEGNLGSPAEWRMIVRGLDRIVFDRNLKVTHLYNLGVDPKEADNLANDPAAELKRAGLRALLKEWVRRTEDRMDASGLKRR